MMILFFLLVEKWCPSVDFREEVYRSKICIKKKKKLNAEYTRTTKGTMTLYMEKVLCGTINTIKMYLLS